MKKALMRIVALALCLTMLSASALAYETLDDPIPLDDLPLGAPEVQIQLNGQIIELTYGVAPYFDSQANRTFVPLRDIFEQLGAQVEYDADTRMITATRGDTTVVMSQDGYDISVTQGQETRVITSDVAPKTIQGRVMVPVRFVSNALGAHVGWDQANKTVVILDTKTISLEGEEPSFELMRGMQGLLDVDTSKSVKMGMEMDVTTATVFEGVSMDIAMAGKMGMLIDSTGYEADVMVDSTITLGGESIAEKAEMRMLVNYAELEVYLRSAQVNAENGVPAEQWLKEAYTGNESDLFGAAGAYFDSAVDTLGEYSPDNFDYLESRSSIIDHYAGMLGLDSIDAFDTIMLAMELEVTLNSDAVFKKSGRVYSATLYDYTDDDGTRESSTAEITVDAAGRVVSWVNTIKTEYEGEAIITTTKVEKGKVTISSTSSSGEINIAVTIESSDKAPQIVPGEDEWIYVIVPPTGDDFPLSASI